MTNDGQTLFLTDNGFEFLGEHLTQIYGERGAPEHNLRRYAGSGEYSSVSRQPQSLDEITEVTVDQLRAFSDEQERSAALARETCEKYDVLQREKRITDTDYREFAEIFGILPGKADLKESLFPHLVDFSFSSPEEEGMIRSAAKEHFKTIELLTDGLFDSLRDGHYIRTPERGEILSQGYVRYYFRGENVYNASTHASFFRGLSADSREHYKLLLPRAIRLAQFLLWLDSLHYIKEDGDFMKTAIAQHYGIYTNFVDVTSDLNAALFFACCKYDGKAKKWAPLTKKDFETADADKRVKERGGDCRYGILFSESADIAELQRHTETPEFHFTTPIPLGYVPFYRMPSQHGFLINTSREYDLFTDNSFAKVKFRHDEDFCKFIFDKMEQGNKIYSSDDVGSFAIAADKINSSYLYTEAGLRKAMMILNIEEERFTDCQKILNRLGWIKREQITWLTSAEQKALDEAWSKENYFDKFNVPGTFRFGFCI